MFVVAISVIIAADDYYLSSTLRYWALFVGAVVSIVNAIAFWIISTRQPVWWYYKIIFICVVPFAMAVWFYRVDIRRHSS
jgi:uncharacterized membrane protein